MTPLAALAVLGAGAAAGTINAVVGSGTLVTFPTLLALGYPPVTANVSNNIGLVFGGITGTWGYRRELAGQRQTLTRLAPMSFLGAITGAVLLLRLPAAAFTTIVPVLIALALVLVVLQPRLAAATAARRERVASAIGGGTGGGAGRPAAGPAAQAGVLLAGVYGGYFGAAQGVLLVGLLGSLLPETLTRVNAAKNLLSFIVNTVAAVTFLLVRPAAVAWPAVALIAAGSLFGGWLGARVGRRLSAPVLRAVILAVGLVAIGRLVWR